MFSKQVLALAFGALFLVLGTARGVCAETLYPELSRKAVVKVHIELPADATEKHQVRPEALKAAFETAFAGRKSLKFQVLPSPDGADLRIATKITEFLWTPDDPVDMIVGIGAVAMDAAVREPYARLQAEFTITDGSGRARWKSALKATITKKDMTEAQSLDLITEDMAKVLLREAFGKKRGDHRR